MWVLLFKLTGVSFGHAFKFAQLENFINIENIILLILTGALLSGAIVTINYFKSKQNKFRASLSALTGTLFSIITLFLVFKNPVIFALMMVFYLAGILLLIYFPLSKERKGVFKELLYGWNLSKEIIYLLAIGGFVVGMIGTASTLDERQDQFKGSVVNATQSQIGEIDINKLIESEDGSSGMSFNITKEWFEENIFRTQILPEYNESLYNTYNLTWSDLPGEKREEVINESYERFKQNFNTGGMISGIQSELTEEIQRTIQEKMSGELVEGMFQQIPIFKFMIDMLPVVTGIVISSFILLYGSIFISPFSALIVMVMSLEIEHEEAEEKGEKKKKKQEHKEDSEEKKAKFTYEKNHEKGS